MIRTPLARVKNLKTGVKMAFLIAYGVCVLVMGVLDFFWLTTASNGLYQKDLGPLLAENPNMVVAVIFYLTYIVGIQVFAIRPALASGDWKSAALFGALFGFFTYATYDLTNMATMKVWTLRVTLLDIAWGTVLTGITASAGALAALRFAR